MSGTIFVTCAGISTRVLGTDNGDGTASMAFAPGPPVASGAACPSLFTNLGANATLNVKASAGNVFSLYCANANGAARWIQLHNTATVPAGAAVPLLTFQVPAGGSIVIGADFFTAAGLHFTTGIAFAFSTTAATYTAATAGDQTTMVTYK